MKVINTASLNSMSLPIEFARSTLPRRLPKGFPELYDQKYDFTTLFYDVIYNEALRVVRFFCPKLLNFEIFFSNSLVEIDGQRVHYTIRRFARYDLVECHVPHRPRTCSLRVDGNEPLVADVGEREVDLFAGSRALLTMSKNNRVPWIRDWVIHHVTFHGADALLLIDNDSTSYT